MKNSKKVNGVSLVGNRSVLRLNQSIQCVSCHNRSYKRDLPRKAIPGIRAGISQRQKIVKAYVLFFQTN